MPPPLPSRTRFWKDKHELSIHQAVSETPEDQALVARLVSDWTARIAAGEDPHSLIRETIKINAADEIGDGRHRELAALRVPQITQVECEILAESEFADLIMEMLLQRRHYSKSARAYALRHMAAKAAKAGAEARGANLVNKVKGGGYRKPTESAFDKKPTEITLESLALKSDLSTDLLGQAVKLEAWYMPKADQLVADWLQLHPDENEMWLAWQETHPYAAMPWTAWRMQRLAEMGVPDDATSVHSIPRHWREIEEDKIFNGIHDPSGEDCDRLSYSLGSALKAMGSYFATAGKPRPDISHENPALHLTLVNKVVSFSKTMWANWSDIEPPARMEVLKKLTTAITGGTDEHGKAIEPWPEDARQAVLVALSKR
jgi:lambda repressor-like predicted transcriptional regulator